MLGIRSEKSALTAFLSLFVLYAVLLWFIFGPEALAGFDSVWPLTVAAGLVLTVLIFHYFLLVNDLSTESGEAGRDLTNRTDSSSVRELKQKLEQLQAENESLQEMDQAKSEFISVAAHQLKTPLSGVKWSLDMLINGDTGELNQDQLHLLNKSYESNERMISLINNMLNLDRIESNRTEINAQQLDLKQVFDDLLYYVIPRAEQKGIAVELEADADLPHVEVDLDKIQQAFQNLLDNAIKYTMKGGKIAVSITREGDSVLTVISDTGIGIPKDQQDGMFKKFFRSSNAKSIQSHGTGIGLYVVKEMVERHGGKIWFDSQEGRGSTFYLSLPIEQPK